jgi:hypothetical protein
LTRILAVLAVLAVLAGAAAVVRWHGASPAGGNRPVAIASTSTPLPAADPVAADPCSWLAAADLAAVGVTTSPLVGYQPPTGLQPGEFLCRGSGGVTVDLRWSIDAKTAGIDLTTWVMQIKQAGWTIAPAAVPHADADYLSAVLGPDGRSTPAAEILVRAGALRIALTLPPAAAHAKDALTSLAAVMVARIATLGVTKAPTPLPAASPSSGPA